MKRDKMQELVRWKERADRKPLVVRGARQTGKTWLLREFGRTHYTTTVYVNFENTPQLQHLFEPDLSPERIIAQLEMYYDVNITAGDTLIIFDEIQTVSRGLTSLKYFCEEAPQYHVAVAGSLLGMGIHQQTSFPVGKVNFMNMHPMTFLEFLDAVGQERLAKAVRGQQWDMLTPFHTKLMEWLKSYLYIGGMPEAVKCFAETKDYNAVREIQQQILTSYQADFSKHTPVELYPRLSMVWQSLPAQLSKENKKFIYGVIREGARAKDFELAIAWLEECGLLLRCPRVSKPAMPLAAYADMAAFKLYMVDVGLLAAMCDLQQSTLLGGSNIFTEFKGALTEQYVMQELTAHDGAAIAYWTNERSTSEVDFIVQRHGNIYPIEVKAEVNLRARSFRAFCDKYQPTQAYRTAATPYKEEEWMTNVPLYAAAIL